MALKSNFEDANFISSPFVDEIANPSHGGVLGQIERNVKTRAKIQRSLLGPEKPTAKISKADREAAIKGTPDATAQATVDLAELKFGDKAGNKNRDKAEGR